MTGAVENVAAAIETALRKHCATYGEVAEAVIAALREAGWADNATPVPDDLDAIEQHYGPALVKRGWCGPEAVKAIERLLDNASDAIDVVTQRAEAAEARIAAARALCDEARVMVSGGCHCPEGDAHDETRTGCFPPRGWSLNPDEIREALGGETATRDEGPAKGSESHGDARTGVETDAETLEAQRPAQAVYVAMICDRHTEPEPEVFTTAQAAIDYARTKAREYCRREEDFEEEDLDGWLYYARYSCEGDSVWVIAKTLDSEAGGDETGNARQAPDDQ